MFKRRYGVVLSMALLGLMSFAAVAHGEGNWHVETKNVTSAKSFGGEGEGHVTFLLPPSGTEILCEKFIIDSGLLLEGGKSSGTFLLSKCILLEKKVVIKCPFAEPIVAKFKGELFLHNFKTYDLIAPAEGKVLFPITFAEGTACTLEGAEWPITGSMVLEDSAFATEQITHLVRPVAAGLFPEDTLKFGGQAAALDGSAIFSLSGAETGKKWSGLG